MEIVSRTSDPDSLVPKMVSNRDRVVSRDVPDLNCVSCSHFPFGATPPLGILSTRVAAKKELYRYNYVFFQKPRKAPETRGIDGVNS